MKRQLVLMLVLSLLLSVVCAFFLGVDLTTSQGIGWVIGYGIGTILIALILCGIPAGIFWLIKRKRMPKFNVSVWVVWALIFALSLFGNSI